MACPAARVLLGLGHLLLWATWMACGSTSFPWPSSPSGAVQPLEAEATAVCRLTPKAQSALQSSLGTERESKLIERNVSPWTERVILKLGCVWAMGWVHGCGREVKGEDPGGSLYALSQGTSSGPKANGSLWIQSRAGIFKSLAHETPEEWVDLEFRLKKRRLRVI